jgi:hypothetical protein
MTAIAAVQPRDVFCVTGHLRRDRGVADDAVAGRFTENGVTLSLGSEPDWLGADFPADEEWRIAWSKSYWGLDLAFAFAQTRSPGYLRAWERLVCSFVEQVPPGLDPSDAVGRRLLNWIYAWNAFARAPAFDGLAGGVEGLLLDSIAEQAAWLRDNVTRARNHRTLELYALFVVALALPGRDPEGELLEWAVAELERNLATDFRPDGVHVEASTHYHLIAARSFVGLRENARRFGIPLSGRFDARLGRVMDFALHCRRPDGEIPALSDADSGSYAELLELAADLLDRPDLRWAATAGRAGAPPAERNVSFPDGGYFVQRSGWGEGQVPYAGERFGIFDCGPLGEGGHGHYDLLSVELAAGGGPLVVDPGRFTYHEGEPTLRHWFKGTAAHNTVLVDGRDQTEYHRRKPRGPIASGRFLGRLAVAGLDVLWGEATTPRYDAVHRRRLIFVAGEYWIVEDRLRAESPHRYDQRWHLAPASAGAVTVADDPEWPLVRAPGVALAFAPGVRLAVEPGWYAPRYGIREAAPVVSAAVDGAGDAALITLVMPLPAGRRLPALRVERDTDGGVTVSIAGTGPGGALRDTVAWRADGSAAAWERGVA